jgi:rSAM/selenodomain-associated transferase 1
MRRALLVVGKAPRPGQVKTRLVPPLRADDAARLCRAFLEDSVVLGLQLGWEQVTVVHPRGSRATLRAMFPSKVALFEQTGRGLSNALASAFEHHLAAGFDRVVLIGSDNPTLPTEIPAAACSALEHCDLVVGPSVDGGYYLIGMSRSHARLFEGIEWSTPRVFNQTLARASHLGLRVQVGPEWYDVDQPADLQRLRIDLTVSPPQIARHTRIALQQLDVGVEEGLGEAHVTLA